MTSTPNQFTLWQLLAWVTAAAVPLAGWHYGGCFGVLLPMYLAAAWVMRKAPLPAMALAYGLLFPFILLSIIFIVQYHARSAQGTRLPNEVGILAICLIIGISVAAGVIVAVFYKAIFTMPNSRGGASAAQEANSAVQTDSPNAPGVPQAPTGDSSPNRD
jgi:hypothetical protein